MRFKFGIFHVAWSAFSFSLVALAALCAGCEPGGGGDDSANKPAASQVQKENAQKIQDDANAAAKKGGATVKFHGKPGAAGGN